MQTTEEHVNEETRQARNVFLLEAVGWQWRTHAGLYNFSDTPAYVDTREWRLCERPEKIPANVLVVDLCKDMPHAAYWRECLLIKLTHSRFSDWPALAKWAHYQPDTPVLRVYFDFNGEYYCAITTHRGQLSFYGYGTTHAEAFLSAAYAALHTLEAARAEEEAGEDKTT